MTGTSGSRGIARLDALAALLTLPCSIVWSKDGPSCTVKLAAALYTEASRAVCQEPVSALSNLFPMREEHTFYIPDAFTHRIKHTRHMETWYFVAIYVQCLCAYHFEALQQNTEGRCIGQKGWTNWARWGGSRWGNRAANRGRCWTCRFLFTPSLLWLPESKSYQWEGSPNLELYYQALKHVIKLRYLTQKWETELILRQKKQHSHPMSQ